MPPNRSYRRQTFQICPTRPSLVSLDAKWLPLDVKQLDAAEADATLDDDVTR
jgi:hypothetical protein